VIDVGGAALEARELFEAIIARKRQPVEGEQDDDPSPESLFGARVTFASTLLAARGYSVTQIVQGLILDAVRFSDADTPFGDVDPQHPEEGLDYYCAYIQHTSGVMLKPEYPPVDVIQELVCDSAPESAPTLFVDKEIKAAVEGGKSGEAAPGGATPGGVTPGAPGGQTSPAAGESGPPDVGLLNGTWKGTTKTTKASVEGMDISEMQTEGCDPTDIYRVTHKITVELDLKPDGSGTITWTGDSVGLESSGLVESLPGGTASVDWTWGDGRLQIAAAPETGGTLVLDATLETPADETIVLDGTWNGTGTEVLDEEELDLVGSGTFTLTKQVEQ